MHTCTSSTIFKTCIIPCQRHYTHVLHIQRWKLRSISKYLLYMYLNLWYTPFLQLYVSKEGSDFPLNNDFNWCLNWIQHNDVTTIPTRMGSLSDVSRSWKSHTQTQIFIHHKIPLTFWIWKRLNKLCIENLRKFTQMCNDFVLSKHNLLKRYIWIKGILN